MATCTWNSIRSNGIAALLCAHMGFQKTLIIYGRAFTVIIIYMYKGYGTWEFKELPDRHIGKTNYVAFYKSVAKEQVHMYILTYIQHKLTNL